MTRATARGMARIMTVGLVALLLGCSSPRADVGAERIGVLVARDSVPFDGPRLPAAALAELAANRVVVLGETHHLREHWELVANLVGNLHADGFRQLLLEAPHMAGWLFDDYVQGGSLLPGWVPPPFYERKLSALRALNETLDPDQRVHVLAIDANEEWYGGARDFEALVGLLVETLPAAGPLGELAGSGYGERDGPAQLDLLREVGDLLERDRARLEPDWGDDRYEAIVELIDVEEASVAVRALRADDDDAAARRREALIKELVEARVGGCDCGTVVNIGAHHAQKSHLMGTEQEWLGDYLAHSSEAAAGSAFVIGFSTARTELEPGAGGTPFDILTSRSPGEEILRTMAEVWPGRNVFMALDDATFADETVAYNSEDVIHVTRLAEQFDALVQYGLAHRMPDS